CNLFVDAEADLEMARRIAISSKCGRPGVCNAIENLVVDAGIAEEFLPACAKELSENGCELLVDERSAAILGDLSTKPADEKDYHEEFLDLRLSVKVVDSMDEAIAFVNRFGSGHSESIITKNKDNANRFLREVDASSVYWNASTRFTDGFEFGLGAEIGISTDRLHARGPMGLQELCTYKYQITGDGQWK
ncbi:MAG TPA: gamma-glutamyl-phosphate reductase, partial [Opitutae bacterium]|nr:gamma-glutamyl-phosphate reductase [Opitutae bacterium]